MTTPERITIWIIALLGALLAYTVEADQAPILEVVGGRYYVVNPDGERMTDPGYHVNEQNALERAFNEALAHPGKLYLIEREPIRIIATAPVIPAPDEPAERPAHDPDGPPAIAGMLTVPYSTAETVELLAYHKDEIARVAWSTGETTRGDGLHRIDAPAEGGLVEATVYPVQGEPRTLSVEVVEALEDRVAWVSPKGDDATGDGTREIPFATFGRAADALQDDHGDTGGATIYAEPGRYALGHATVSSRTGWLTIAGAPEADPSEVIIDRAGAGSRITTHRLRLHNLTMDGVRSIVTPDERAIWFDGCVMRGNALHAAASDYRAGIYVTHCRYEDARGVIRSVRLMRDVQLKDFVGTVAQNVPLVYNVTADGVSNGGDSSVKPDFLQVTGSGAKENYLWVNVTLKNNASQGVLVGASGTLNNVALVNAHIENHDPHKQNQWNGKTDHLVIRNTRFIHQPLRVAANITNGVIVDSDVELSAERAEMIEGVEVRD